MTKENVPLDQRLAYTKKGAAQALMVSAPTIARLISEGRLTPVQIGGVERISRDQINRLLNGDSTNPAPRGTLRNPDELL